MTNVYIMFTSSLDYLDQDKYANMQNIHLIQIYKHPNMQNVYSIWIFCGDFFLEKLCIWRKYVFFINIYMLIVWCLPWQRWWSEKWVIFEKN